MNKKKAIILLLLPLIIGLKAMEIEEPGSPADNDMSISPTSVSPSSSIPPTVTLKAAEITSLAKSLNKSLTPEEQDKKEPEKKTSTKKLLLTNDTLGNSGSWLPNLPGIPSISSQVERKIEDGSFLRTYPSTLDRTTAMTEAFTDLNTKFVHFLSYAQRAQTFAEHARDNQIPLLNPTIQALEKQAIQLQNTIQALLAVIQNDSHSQQ